MRPLRDVLCALLIMLIGCVEYRAIERHEGVMPKSGKYIVLVNGDDALQLVGEVRNALSELGIKVCYTIEEASYIANLSYSISKKGTDARIETLSLDVKDAASRKRVAYYTYNRNNENTDDWSYQIRKLIGKSVDASAVNNK